MQHITDLFVAFSEHWFVLSVSSWEIASDWANANICVRYHYRKVLKNDLCLCEWIMICHSHVQSRALFPSAHTWNRCAFISVVIKNPKLFLTNCRLSLAADPNVTLSCTIGQICLPYWATNIVNETLLKERGSQLVLLCMCCTWSKKKERMKFNFLCRSLSPLSCLNNI